MASLYEFTEQAKMLMAMLDADEIDEQTVNDTLEAMMVEDKLDSYCKVIRQYEADAADYKAEKQFFADKQARAEKAIERMKETLSGYMQATQKDKLAAGKYTLKLSQSKAVNITDEAKIPESFVVLQAPKIDKSGIRKALLSGEVVDGAELEVRHSVQIK